HRRDPALPRRGAGGSRELLLRHGALREPRGPAELARVREARARALRERLALRAGDRRRVLHGTARRLRRARRRRPRGDRSTERRAAVPAIRHQGGLMTQIDVPVLIVGGGGAGLTASMLLSRLGVESLLVSALPTTSILPKAHVLNQRTMEIFTD